MGEFTQLAEKLGMLSGYPTYQLFLCKSGAKANENAVKLASFATGRKKVIAFSGAFHGRASETVAATDNYKIMAPFNRGHDVKFLYLNDASLLNKKSTVPRPAVIIEDIEGVGGIRVPSSAFLQTLEDRCRLFAHLRRSTVRLCSYLKILCPPMS